jgi:uncharacterized protein (DUF1330 family)
MGDARARDRGKLRLSGVSGYGERLLDCVFSNPAALAQYAKVAEPAILAAGGRILTRGSAIRAFEAGIKDRSIVIEFDSPTRAIEAYESPAYQSALKILEGAVERDVRILEGVS